MTRDDEVAEVGDENSEVARDFARIVNRAAHKYLADELCKFDNRPAQRYNAYGDCENDFIYVSTLIGGKRFYARLKSKIKDSTVRERRNYMAAGDKILAVSLLDIIMRIFKEGEPPLALQTLK